MHFHQLFRWCHEAWEESLARYGIAAGAIFPGCRDSCQVPTVALPIVHCEADFQRPVHGGDDLKILLEPHRLDPGCFEVRYRFQLLDVDVARALIRHLAIETESRRRCALPEPIELWLEASTMGRLEPI